MSLGRGKGAKWSTPEYTLFGSIACVLLFLLWDDIFHPQKAEMQLKERAAQREAERAKEISENKITSDGKGLYTDPDTGCVYFLNPSSNGYRVLTIRNGKDGKQVGCGNVKE